MRRRNDNHTNGVAQPQAPDNLHLLSRELLESLAGHAEAAKIVIGGGVALSHSLPYRDTVDLDACWRPEPRADVLTLLESVMQSIAARHELEYQRQSWSETESLELLQGGRKQFSFQIARRTLAIDDAIPSAWHPVRIETLRDDVTSKMMAIAQRGVPRDFLDIYRLCTRGVSSMAERWTWFIEKNPEVTADEAKRKIIARLAMIETTRPIETNDPGTAREHATRVRDWYHQIFTANSP